MEGNAFPSRQLTKEEFPALLHEIPDPPKALRIRGALPHTDNEILTVVGSRRASSYGREAARFLIKGIAAYPITIVSGLALGIDGIAHEAALEAGLHTIAVPGSGINDKVIYPRSHKALADRILEYGGGLLSEYEDNFRATEWAFPKRNRIMAGMSHAVLIIEANEKPGTLVTARLALDYNRELIAVPGSIFSQGSIGPHMLMRDGAAPATTPLDVLLALGIRPKEEQRGPIIDDPRENILLSLLESPLEKDALIRAAHMPSQEANIALSKLELRGYVREENGIIMRIVTIQ